MRTSCSLGSLLSIRDVLSCAKRLSETGVHTIWVPETWGMENFSMLGAISGVTSKPYIGSSIVNVYSRSPAAIAMGAATIDTLSGGRLILGLGASSPAIVGGLHGMPYSDPLQRVRECVEIVRMAISGRRMNHKGRIFSLNGFGLLVKPVRDRIPIYLAAVNRNMTRLAWEIGDGVIFYLRPADEMRRTIDVMRKESGRGNVDVACQLVTCVSDDETAAMERARRTISFYVAVGKVYRDFLASNGFEGETAAIHDEFRHSGTMDRIYRLVPDEMVHALAIAGTPNACRQRLAAFRDAGVDLPIIQFNPVGNVAESFEMCAGTFFGGTP